MKLPVRRLDEQPRPNVTSAPLRSTTNLGGCWRTLQGLTEFGVELPGHGGVSEPIRAYRLRQGGVPVAAGADVISRPTSSGLE